MSAYRDFVIRWNDEHPLDRRFRKKYGIAFNSEEHRRINQLDIVLEFVEDAIFEEIEERVIRETEDAKLYEKGQWLKDQIFTEEDEQDLFDKLDISKINKNE